jgi:hypothetical protein
VDDEIIQLVSKKLKESAKNNALLTGEVESLTKQNTKISSKYSLTSGLFF